MKPSGDIAFEIASQISEYDFDGTFVQGDKNQFKVACAPLIGNAMHHNKLEAIENERIRTIISLSRIIPDDDMLIKVIKGLNYKIDVR